MRKMSSNNLRRSFADFRRTLAFGLFSSLILLAVFISKTFADGEGALVASPVVASPNEICPECQGLLVLPSVSPLSSASGSGNLSLIQNVGQVTAQFPGEPPGYSPSFAPFQGPSWYSNYQNNLYASLSTVAAPSFQSPLRFDSSQAFWKSMSAHSGVLYDPQKYNLINYSTLTPSYRPTYRPTYSGAPRRMSVIGRHRNPSFLP
jgi:hypothetical protein